MNLESTFEDYTDMVEGAKTDGGGIVARCPRCGRLGRLTEEADIQTFDHRRTGPDETRETCVIPPSQA